MKRIFIIHGWSFGPDDNWTPWLKAELERLGYEVTIPAMPDTNEPVIEKWVPYLAEIVGTPDKDTYFVGHSIGCQTILRYLETIDMPVGGALFVAGWFKLENLEDEETKELARPWTETPINAEKIKGVLPRSTLIISDNDPYGAFEENKRSFAELGTRIIEINGAGHLTTEDGYAEIPIVIEELRKITQ